MGKDILKHVDDYRFSWSSSFICDNNENVFMKWNQRGSFYWNPHRFSQGCNPKFYSPEHARSLRKVKSVVYKKKEKNIQDKSIKLHNYCSKGTNKLAFFENYGNMDRVIRKQKAEQMLHDENNIAGNAMVGNMVKESSNNMLLSPPHNHIPYKIIHQLVEGDESYSIKDERTIYCEIIATVFKIFGNITGEIVHVWCEKSQPESRMFYLETHDYSLKGFDKKVLDGIGTLPDIPRTYLIFEPSGYGRTENINHSIENNIKNMKSATDSLKHCAFRYKTASFATFTNVHLFAVHIIQNKMTLTRYSYNENKKFDIIEVRSCKFPLTFADNKKFLKMMELFAFLCYDLQEQKDVFDQLDDERNGVIDIEETEMVKYVSH